MSEDSIGIVSDSGMPRICVRIPRSQRESIENLVEEGKFPNMSEAIRSAVRSQSAERM